MNLDWSILDKAEPYSPPSKKKIHVMSYREISYHFLYKDNLSKQLFLIDFRHSESLSFILDK